ncbi:MAG: hypothetical protein AAFR59_15215, partial [Bacteroidota bacterium]
MNLLFTRNRGLISCILFCTLLVCFGESQATDDRHFDQTTPLSGEIEKIALVHEVNIVYDIDQVKNVHVSPIQPGKSV